MRPDRAAAPDIHAQPVLEKVEMHFLVENVNKDDKVIRNILDYNMTIDVELMYLPFGRLRAEHSHGAGSRER